MQNDEAMQRDKRQAGKLFCRINKIMYITYWKPKALTYREVIKALESIEEDFSWDIIQTGLYLKDSKSRKKSKKYAIIKTLNLYAEATKKDIQKIRNDIKELEKKYPKQIIKDYGDADCPYK